MAGRIVTQTLVATCTDLAGAVNNTPDGYDIGDAAMDLDALTVASSSIPAGSRFKVTGDDTLYTVTAAGTITTGAVTALAFDPPLVAAAADNAVVTFEVHTDLFDTPGKQDFLAFSVSGIAGGAVLTPEGSFADWGGWFGVGITPMTSTTMATTISADGNYRCDVRGLKRFRLRVSGAGTGTITIQSVLH